MCRRFFAPSWVAPSELPGNQVRLVTKRFTDNVKWGEGMKEQLCHIIMILVNVKCISNTIIRKESKEQNSWPKYIP